MADRQWTGGCQCGAVRFAARALGRASICHCRMCQKAFGGFFGPLVTVHDLTWTRGAPSQFASSNHVKRGFCNQCGTPLTYEPDHVGIDIAIGAFDRAAEIEPSMQVGMADRMPWFDRLAGLALRPPSECARVNAFLSNIVSFQHPDHDTPAGDKDELP